MEYTIKQAAEITGLSNHTIRYYDKEGLLPLISRTSSGTRRFSDDDIAWLQLICCLKNSGMSIQHIQQFMGLCLQGQATCEQRREMLIQHKQHILEQMAQLEQSLEMVNYKIDNYEKIGVFHIDH